MDQTSMKDRVVLVTGSTDGIGKATALGLARLGVRVLLHGRDESKGQMVLEEIESETGNDRLEPYTADLSIQRQVRALAAQVRERHDRLDVLINNAGTYKKERLTTEDGVEMTFAVNHLAPFLLTHLLLEPLRNAAPSRIVNVASIAHRSARVDWDILQGTRGYDGYEAYALSKLGAVLFTKELAERLKGSGITVNCLHPGVIKTKLLRAGFGDYPGEPPERGAERVIYLACSSDLADVSGKYFEDNRPSQPSSLARDRSLRKRFWRMSEEMTRLNPHFALTE